MASRAAARSGANSSRVELTNTRTRWSGVRITAGPVGATVGWLAAFRGGSVAIVSQVLSRNRVSPSLTCTPENWEVCFNMAYLLPLFTTVVYLALLLSSNSEHM